MTKVGKSHGWSLPSSGRGSLHLFCGKPEMNEAARLPERPFDLDALGRPRGG